jgi:pilus assembly protein CpaB
MKPKTIIPLIVGLGVGFFAIKMGVDMVRKAKGSQENRREILISARTIEVATDIQESMLTTQEVAESLVSSDSFVKKEDLIGRVTKMPVPAGVAITKAMLAPKGAKPGLGAKIPPGHRAVSISVNEESAVAGFIAPGNRVDVSVVHGRGAEARSKLILSDVEVGAVGQSLSREEGTGKNSRLAKSVTLFLRPEHVQILNAAMGGGKGKLRLSLRGHGGDPAETLFSRFFQMASAIPTISMPAPQPEPQVKPEPKPEPAPRIHVVQVRRGETVERFAFDPFGGVQRFSLDAPMPARHAAPSGPQQPAASDSNDDEDASPPDMEIDG